MNFVSGDEMYCRHHKDQMTANDQRELEQQKRKNTMIAVVGFIIFAPLVALAAAGG